MVTIEEVQRFFFRAQRHGWAADAASHLVPDMPGYKEISFREGNFTMIDRYCVNSDSKKSAGMKTIWFQDMPVWVMNYGGWYDKAVIPFLKDALCVAYAEETFFGGRGPLAFREGDDPQFQYLIYSNSPCKNDFREFRGSECIVAEDVQTLLGSHTYSGMSLLE